MIIQDNLPISVIKSVISKFEFTDFTETGERVWVRSGQDEGQK